MSDTLSSVSFTKAKTISRPELAQVWQNKIVQDRLNYSCLRKIRPPFFLNNSLNIQHFMINLTRLHSATSKTKTGMQLRMSSVGILSLQAGHRDIWAEIGTVRTLDMSDKGSNFSQSTVCSGTHLGIAGKCMFVYQIWLCLLVKRSSYKSVHT